MWATIPEWDAPDEVIERYLDHLNACPHHAELECRRTGAVQMTFDAARSVAEDGALTFSEQEEAEAFAALDRLADFRESGARVGALTLKVDGEEIGSLDFAGGRKLKKKIGRRQPLQIYGRASAGGPELLLSTYVPAAQDHPDSYRVRLNDQQTLLLDVQPSRGAKVQFKLSCLSPVPDAERRGLFSVFGIELWSPGRFALGVLLFVITSIGVLGYLNPKEKTPVAGPQNINTASQSEQANDLTNKTRQTDHQARPVEKSGDGKAVNRAQKVKGRSDGGGRVRRTPERPTRSKEERADFAALVSTISGTQEDKTAVLESLRAGEISFAGSDFEILTTRATESDKVSPVYPKQEATLETNPNFRWQGAEGLEYRVIVTYLDGKEVTSSKVLTQNNGRLEEELKPGIYYWRIATRRKGRKEESVTGFTIFKILSEAEKQRLEAAVNSTGSNLVRAILYARAALPEKAEAELQAELRKHPRSPAAKKMLGQVRGLR